MIGKLAPRQGRHYKKKQRLKRVTLICEECNEEYEVYPYEEGKRRFCSRTCASRNYHRKVIKRRVITKNCEYCGEEFTRIVPHSKPDPKYCCTDCANKKRWNIKLEKDYLEVANEYLCNV